MGQEEAGVHEVERIGSGRGVDVAGSELDVVMPRRRRLAAGDVELRFVDVDGDDDAGSDELGEADGDVAAPTADVEAMPSAADPDALEPRVVPGAVTRWSTRSRSRPGAPPLT